MATEAYVEGIEYVVTGYDKSLNLVATISENRLGSVIVLHYIYFYFVYFFHSQTLFIFGMTIIYTYRQI